MSNNTHYERTSDGKWYIDGVKMFEIPTINMERAFQLGCKETAEKMIEDFDNKLSRWDNFSPLCPQQMVAMAISEWQSFKDKWLEWLGK